MSVEEGKGEGEGEREGEEKKKAWTDMHQLIYIHFCFWFSYVCLHTTYDAYENTIMVARQMWKRKIDRERERDVWFHKANSCAVFSLSLKASVKRSWCHLLFMETVSRIRTKTKFIARICTKWSPQISLYVNVPPPLPPPSPPLNSYLMYTRTIFTHKIPYKFPYA